MIAYIVLHHYDYEGDEFIGAFKNLDDALSCIASSEEWPIWDRESFILEQWNIERGIKINDTSFYTWDGFESFPSSAEYLRWSLI